MPALITSQWVVQALALLAPSMVVPAPSLSMQLQVSAGQAISTSIISPSAGRAILLLLPEPSTSLATGLTVAASATTMARLLSTATTTRRVYWARTRSITSRSTTLVQVL